MIIKSVYLQMCRFLIRTAEWKALREWPVLHLKVGKRRICLNTTAFNGFNRRLIQSGSEFIVHNLGDHVDGFKSLQAGRDDLRRWKDEGVATISKLHCGRILDHALGFAPVVSGTRSSPCNGIKYYATVTMRLVGNSVLCFLEIVLILYQEVEWNCRLHSWLRTWPWEL